MGRTELQTCELCELPISMSGVFRRQINAVHGIVITLGYSKGGWGSRNNDIDFSGEVCQECYDLLWEAHKDIRRLLKDRRGINSPVKGFDGTEKLNSRRLA